MLLFLCLYYVLIQITVNPYYILGYDYVRRPHILYACNLCIFRHSHTSYLRLIPDDDCRYTCNKGLYVLKDDGKNPSLSSLFTSPRRLETGYMFTRFLAHLARKKWRHRWNRIKYIKSLIGPVHKKQSKLRSNLVREGSASYYAFANTGEKQSSPLLWGNGLAQKHIEPIPK